MAVRGCRKSAEEILDGCSVGSRAGFYSGRGVTTSDLDDRKLQQCFDAIAAHIGDDAATNFVDMVASMERMTATGFINAVYALEANGWVHVDGPQPRAIDPDSEQSAFATVVDTLARHSRRNAESTALLEARNDVLIRAEFLCRHGYKDANSTSPTGYPAGFFGLYYNESSIVAAKWVLEVACVAAGPSQI